MDLFHRQILLQQGSDVILEPDNKYQTNYPYIKVHQCVQCPLHCPLSQLSCNNNSLVD